MRYSEERKRKPANEGRRTQYGQAPYSRKDVPVVRWFVPVPDRYGNGCDRTNGAKDEYTWRQFQNLRATQSRPDDEQDCGPDDHEKWRRSENREYADRHHSISMSTPIGTDG